MPYKDKEKRKEQSRLYALTHKEAVREAKTRWRLKNKDKQAECQRNWKAKNTDKVRSYQKKYNRECWLNYLDSSFSWSEVEGFDNWTVNTVVHHRLEMFGFSRDELKEQGRYFNCTPDELICMTTSEHISLHWYLRSLTKKNP